MTAAPTVHLGNASREGRPHLLGGRQPASSLQQRRALLEVLPRLPQAAAGWTPQRKRTLKHRGERPWFLPATRFLKICFVFPPAGDKGLHEEQGRSGGYEQDVGKQLH